MSDTAHAVVLAKRLIEKWRQQQKIFLKKKKKKRGVASNFKFELKRERSSLLELFK
jgi:hypothetical protein